MPETAAERLWQARVTHQPLARDFAGYPTSEAEAYEIQAAMIAASRLDVIGWKIGATTAPLLEVLGMKEPFLGPLFANFTLQSGAEMAVHPGHGLETEFTIRLKSDLPYRADPYGRDEIEAAVAAIIPSFEIIGFRFEGEPAGAGFRLIADGGVNVGTVLGTDVTTWDADTLAGHDVSLAINDAVMQTGRPSDLLWDHLFDAVSWAACHPTMEGRGLKAGEIIMTGTCTGMTPLSSGDRAMADFGAMGRVSAAFS